MFSVCVGVMGEVWFSFFSYVSFFMLVCYTHVFPCTTNNVGLPISCITNMGDKNLLSRYNNYYTEWAAEFGVE